MKRRCQLEPCDLPRMQVGNTCWKGGWGGGVLLGKGGGLNSLLRFPPHVAQLSMTPALPQGIYPGVAPPLCSKHLRRGAGVGFAAPGGAGALQLLPAQELCSTWHSCPGCAPWGWDTAALGALRAWKQQRGAQHPKGEGKARSPELS